MATWGQVLVCFLLLVYVLWVSLMRVPVIGFRVHLTLDWITIEKSLLPSKVTFPGPTGEDVDVYFGRKATKSTHYILQVYVFFPPPYCAVP